MNKHYYGWNPSVPNRINDFLYEKRAVNIPLRVDLSTTGHLSLPASDQLQLGACGPNAACKIMDFIRHKEGMPWMYPSRLALYYMTRERSGDTDTDSGVQNSDLTMTLINNGVCPESEWPYDISQFAVKPPAQCYTDALKELALVTELVDNQDMSAIKNVLASGYPILAGIPVYESFETDEVARTGQVPMPQTGEELLGGHDVTLIGYNEAKKLLIFMNSWGAWGKGGCFSTPYAYAQLGSDWRVIRKVE